jgi:hypothetical protein
MMDNSRCAILVPVSRTIEPHCDLALRQLEWRGFHVHRLYGFSQIDVARNRLATEALAANYEELMWIDSDMAFEPQSVDRLRSHNLPVSCGLYPTKVERKLTSSLLPGTPAITFGEEGGLLEIQYAATGFLHTRREVYLEIIRCGLGPTCNAHLGLPMVAFFLPMIVEHDGGLRYLAEDYAFSERLRRCNYRVYADTTIRLQHIGIYGYSWEDLGGSLPRSATYVFPLESSRPRESDSTSETPDMHVNTTGQGA